MGRAETHGIESCEARPAQTDHGNTFSLHRILNMVNRLLPTEQFH